MIEILSKQESEKILNKLNSQFGIKEIPGILLRIGKERIFLFQGELEVREIKQIEKITFIERTGIYIGKIFEPTGEMRLSIEGTQIFKKQISKNILELNDSQAEQWMQGEEIPLSTDYREIIIIKYQDDFLGCGKASENKIGNFVPKNRRLKSRSIIK